MSLILSEEVVEKVAARLEKESEICHLLVMCTYHTGWHPSRTIQLSTIGAEYFINQNRDFLYDWEIDLLRTYKLENLNNNIVFSNKETGDNISLSDVEKLLSKVVVNGRFCPQSVRNFCPIVAGFNASTYKVPACVL